MYKEKLKHKILEGYREALELMIETTGQENILNIDETVEKMESRVEELLSQSGFSELEFQHHLEVTEFLEEGVSGILNKLEEGDDQDNS